MQQTYFLEDVCEEQRVKQYLLNNSGDENGVIGNQSVLPFDTLTPIPPWASSFSFFQIRSVFFSYFWPLQEKKQRPYFQKK